MAVPRALSRYVGGLAVAAVALWLLLLHAWGIGADGPAGPGLALLLGLLSVVAYQFPLELLRHRKTHVASSPLLAGALLFSPAAALALAVGAAFLGNALLRLPGLPRRMQRRPWWNWVFNAAQTGIALGLASACYHLSVSTSPERSLSSPVGALAALLAAAVAALSNTGAVAVATSLYRGGHPWPTWVQEWRTTWPEEVALALLAIVTAVLATQQLWAVLFLAGTITLIYGLVRRDLTERQRAAARYQALVEQAHDVIFTCDLAGTFTSLNTAGEQLLGYTRAEVTALRLDQLVAPESRALARQLLAPPRVPTDATVMTVVLVAKDGRRVALEVSSRWIDQEGAATGIQAIARDVTERQRWEAALTHQALHDALTDLPNRTLLHERLQQALRLARRHRHPLALLVMDLDRFKEVNDTFGHAVGDRLLQQLGPRLQSVLRESDTVARLGGDEFAVVLPGTDAPGAIRVARKLLTALERPVVIDEGLLIDVVASVGIASFPAHGGDADELLRRADIAMYAAKRARRGVAVYTPEQEPSSVEPLSLRGELRDAIERERLSLHYQPQVQVPTQRVVRAEALVRWQHPQYGLILPGHFVPLAEQLGLLGSLSRWVLNTALGACADWHLQGQAIGISVNLGAQDLHDPALPAAVAQALARFDVAPSWLMLEITESSLVTESPRAVETLVHLRALGVRIAIDDFGTGYASLAYLKRLPVDELKIDRTFIRQLPSAPQDLAIVRATLSLAHDLGLTVTAEGVEDQATWDLLAQLGCDLAQGYAVSPPLPAAAFMRWLREADWGHGRREPS